MKRGAHRREVVEYVALNFVREYDVSRNRHDETRDERQHGRYMRDGREPVERRRSQAPIDQKRIVVADESKADDPNSLENPRLDDRKPFGWVTFQGWRYLWAVNYYGGHDDEHPAERKTGCDGEFVDVAVQ